MSRSNSRSGLLLAALLGALELQTSFASAQTTASETARVTQLFKSGKAAFTRGDLAEAERSFAEAFSIRKSADIAANLGQSELEQQKYRGAAEHFQWALANLLPSATDAQRKAIEVGLARSRAEVAALRLDIEPDGSEVLVGAQNLGKSPVTGSVYVDPGEVIISVKHDGYVAIEKRVMAAKGTEQPVQLTLARQEAPLTPAPASGRTTIDSGLDPNAPPASHQADLPRSETKSLVPAFVATGVAVAGGVAGLIFILTANSKEKDADKLLREIGPGGCGGDAPDAPCSDLKHQRESVDRSRNLALGSFVIGGVAAGVAGYFYWDALSHRRQRASRPASTYALRPSFELAPARRQGAAVESVKFSLSGTF